MMGPQRSLEDVEVDNYVARVMVARVCLYLYLYFTLKDTSAVNNGYSMPRVSSILAKQEVK